MCKKVFLCLCLAVSVLSCQRKQEIVFDTDLEDVSSSSLIIRGLIVFGYENNSLSYQLESQYMIQSIDREVLEFRDFVLQKLDSSGPKGNYLANKAVYFTKENRVVLDEANLEEFHDDVILTAGHVGIDFSDYTLSGENARIIKQGQKMSGQKIFYDLIMRRLEMITNVEGSYGQENEN